MASYQLNKSVLIPHVLQKICRYVTRAALRRGMPLKVTSHIHLNAKCRRSSTVSCFREESADPSIQHK
jgi:hypothetical protein